MRRLLRLARRYWAVTATLVVGALGIVLALAGAGNRARGIRAHIGATLLFGHAHTAEHALFFTSRAQTGIVGR